MKIVQILPELNSGGVERGAVEFARWLVERGHTSIVISNGGRLVEQLTTEGSQHIQFPVHKKSLLSLQHVKPLRKLLLSLEVDVVHVRSRLPAWLTWFAIGRLPRNTRPALVSTFHGLYSINRYSEIMGCGDRVIAISQCVYDYITHNYPKVTPNKISIIHRGVDDSVFNKSFQPTDEWRKEFFSEYPHCEDKPLIVMPGRVTSWKGHEDFIRVISLLKQDGVACHGLVVGDGGYKKDDYFQSLRRKVSEQGLDDFITFTGHRSDIQNVYRIANVICNLSNRPEPFGRTVIEALAMDVPVIAYDQGGPAESLKECFPEGLVKTGDKSGVVKVIKCIIDQKPNIQWSKEFTLNTQAQKTFREYQLAVENK